MQRATAVFALALASAGTRVRAEPAYVPPDFLSVTPELPPGQDGNVWRLALAEALQLAVRQNLGIALERREVQIAAHGVDVARGAFEPTVTADYRHGDTDSPPASVQEGAPGEIFTLVDDGWHVGIGQRFATGTRLALDFGNARERSSLGTAVEPLNYRSTLSLTLTQPLLRGFSADLAIPRIEVLRARIAGERERRQLAVAIAALVEQAEGAYWGVLQAVFRYDLARRSHQAATDQLALTRRQIDAGTLPPSDLIGAESTVAQRQLELVGAEQAIQQASDALRAVLHLPREQWARTILPIDVPRFQPGAPAPEEAFAAAIRQRPELAQLDLDLRAASLAIQKTDNDRLPQLDLGLTGALVGQDRSYGEALGQLGGADAKGWSVAVSLSWTPLQRATAAAAEIARVQHAQAELRREQLVQAVWLEVRAALRDQAGAERQVAAAARFRELAEKSLEIEQRKFLNGTSQNLFVAQRQDALASARQAELDALLVHNRAATALARATGRLLADRHIELEAGR
jgi:outer membrane protein TolC